MKKRIKIAPLCILLLLAALIVAANLWRGGSQVQGIRVDIDYCGADTLVKPQQVSDLLMQRLPDVTSQRLRDVDLGQVAAVAVTSPWLCRCEASTTIGGAVVVHGVQHRPIVRICARGEEYYLDDKGYRVPLSPLGSADLIVASGNIPPRGKGLKQVWDLASYLDGHPRLATLFDQIYRDSRGDLFLTPKLGNHIVQIGSPDNLDSKFINLLAFYTRALPQAGWETYNQISVKYQGQVVATRKQPRIEIKQ